jgi:hypothetical protein
VDVNPVRRVDAGMPQMGGNGGGGGMVVYQKRGASVPEGMDVYVRKP